MAINKTLAAGMLDVAGNAMLVHSIRGQQASLSDANAAIAEWIQHASKLEAKVTQLRSLIEEQGEHIDTLVAKKQELEQKNRELQGELDEARADIGRYEEGGQKDADRFMNQVQYTRDLKIRLNATENALRHSSSKSAGLEKLQEFLIHATACIESKIDIGAEAKQILDRAYQEFIDSNRLTDDPETERVLDELKQRAPDTKPGVLN